MARSNPIAVFVGVGLLLAGIAVVDYKLNHPKCQQCGLVLDAIKLAESAVCPKCGTVLTSVQALLA